MAQISQSEVSYRAVPDEASRNRRLFIACFAAMFATSFAFIVRAMLITQWGVAFNLTETQKGAIFPGAALFPFAISIVLISLFIDELGYGRTMVLAFLGHLVGTVLTIAAAFTHSAHAAYQLLYIGTFITSLANGAIECVVNPVVTTLYAKNKTHYLNMLHAGWPGGLVVAGILAIFMASLSWVWTLALVFVPTIIYGVLLIGQKFPVQERVAAGVSYRDMMREFGAAGTFILTWFLTMAFLTVAMVFVSDETLHSPTWIWLNQWLPLILAGAASVLFLGAYRSVGRPMFVLLLVIMVFSATTELGTDSWITDLLKPLFGSGAGWIIVYTSAIMFVMRFFAGPIIHRLNPLRLLAVCAIAAVIGLYCIGAAGTSAVLVFLAATLYGIGKSFFWPTTLGVVSEQFPKGGALTLNAMGGMGMIAVGVLGGPMLGTLLDKRVDTNLHREAPAIYATVADKEPTTTYRMTYHGLDQDKVKALPKAESDKVNEIIGVTKQTSLKTVAILPVIMFFGYLILILYFNAKGGYKAQQLEMSGEEATGGVGAPVR